MSLSPVIPTICFPRFSHRSCSSPRAPWLYLCFLAVDRTTIIGFCPQICLHSHRTGGLLAAFLRLVRADRKCLFDISLSSLSHFHLSEPHLSQLRSSTSPTHRRSASDSRRHPPQTHAADPPSASDPRRRSAIRLRPTSRAMRSKPREMIGASLVGRYRIGLAVTDPLCCLAPISIVKDRATPLAAKSGGPYQLRLDSDRATPLSTVKDRATPLSTDTESDRVSGMGLVHRYRRSCPSVLC
ncbi:hypothetical protein CMV_025602 [Castanea mollissima]|uniref:Uncharacterized protein n=1 Tax=Castanea mollissima TaxID=60419 RepID=A0A8J4QD47_9ROSI|nr:hypothetical protein CMV_025602 [Castanea mollissima]